MSAKTKEQLNELYRNIREISILRSCESLLDWDERTYMPRNASEHRGNQMALLAGIAHERFVSPRIGELIGNLTNDGVKLADDTPDAANVREIKRVYEKAIKVPKSLVEELSRTIVLSQGAWQEARAKSDFNSFQTWMEKVVSLKRQVAEAVGYRKTPYDALLDDFEPGVTTEIITGVFAGLRNELVELIARIKDSGKAPDRGIIARNFAIERQEQFGKEAASAIGFDFASGRLDVTVHPFCTGIGPTDVRITTRYDENHFPQAFFGILHEAGHGIYEQGLPKEHYGIPCGDSVSLGIHESQSRMWENLVGRSRPFWQYFFPRAQAIFPEPLKGVSLEQFYFAVNDVRPSFIRVEADEATYNLHILLRFEIESAFFNGDLQIGDVPGIWRERFQKYFGITPKNDAAGCLQDVHWSAGLIGYFPTYTLGNLYAAQFFAKAKSDLGNIEQSFAAGDFKGLLGWLRENIHKHGQRYRAEELVKRVTSQPLSHKPLMEYLNGKFGELYGI
ncbi:MAG: peptidase M32 [candidate division Zixibacteria bacterium RBG_16_53_22]|nr:MAG: peptidase M32 [candidate division Zixibacteria bacterium RBG_16_53_22]